MRRCGVFDNELATELLNCGTHKFAIALHCCFIHKSLYGRDDICTPMLSFALSIASIAEAVIQLVPLWN
jgi:hypothetical protein